jgi:hypothetical protein
LVTVYFVWNKQLRKLSGLAHSHDGCATSASWELDSPPTIVIDCCDFDREELLFAFAFRF